MADVYTNCFTIANQAGYDEIVAGVPVKAGIIMDSWRSGDFVKLGSRCRVEVSPDAARSPRGIWLMHARFSQETNRLEAADPEWRGMIIHIIPDGLKFEFEPLGKDLNLWPGGDGNIRPFRQYGAHADIQNKQQLFQLEDGESIVLVDSRTAVSQIWCVKGKPVFGLMDKAKLAIMLEERAKHQKKVQACDWALHNLKALLESGSYMDWVVREAIDRVNRLRAEIS